MLRGIRLSSDELHSIRVVDLNYQRNPAMVLPPAHEPIVGANTTAEMIDIEWDVFSEGLF